jgi:hypothetical protein
VILEWRSVGSLPRDVYYVPRVSFNHSGQVWTDETPWTKTVTWALSDHAYLLDLSDDGVFTWGVQVMRKTGTDPKTGMPVGVPVSRTSAMRTLTWLAERPTSTPIPP